MTGCVKMISFKLFKLLLFLSLLCICVHIILLIHSERRVWRKSEIIAVQRFLPHTKEDVMNHQGMVTNITAKYLHLLNSNSSGSGHNFDSNIITRGEWQEALLLKYCSHVNQSHVRNTKELFNHLIFDDNYGIIYCVVPKTGCTKMKTLFVLLQGLYALDELSNGNVHVTHKHYLHKVKTFEDLSESEREERLKYYYKYMVVRDPFERLVSVYRNKIGRRNMKHETFLKLQRDIIEEFRITSSSSEIDGKIPSFSEFVQYFIAHRNLLDDHFQAMFDLCQPCLIKYNLYVNFHTLSNDMNMLLPALRLPRQFYFNDIKIGPSLMPKNQSNDVLEYYSQLSDDLKVKVMNKLTVDSEMYHHLYPNKK